MKNNKINNDYIAKYNNNQFNTYYREFYSIELVKDQNKTIQKGLTLLFCLYFQEIHLYGDGLRSHFRCRMVDQ